MAHPPLWQLGAAELLAGYRASAFTPRDAAEACLARIEAVQPRLNAFVALRLDAARAEAEASTARWAAGAPCGPLDGLPLAVKDNLPTADLPTAWGCVALQGHRTAADELAVARARAAGAVIVGKTNVPEFTLEGYTHNRLFGTTRNPWDPRLTPGGSSGGSAAAVAAGCVPLALGTDGGGSIRRPASHTGLVGFKPSIGSVAREHALPPLLLDFEVVGPLARTVADARVLFEAVRGPSPGDRRSYAAAAAGQAAGALPARPRVLYVPTLDGAPVDPGIAAACRAFVGRLAERGHLVEEGALPLDIGFMTKQWLQVGQMGLAWLLDTHPAWRDGISPKYLEMAAQGAALPAAALWDLLETVERLRAECARLFERVDLVITPATAALPWAADEAFPPEIDGRPVGPRGHAVFTGWVNAAGLPAVALPSAPAPGGLPTGVQAIAGYGRDDALLVWAAEVEADAPWAQRRPALE